MARNRREQGDPRVIKDWIREGRGQNRNGAYKPWLNTQDVASQGIRDQFKSHLSGDRALQLLSGLETDCFNILAWIPSVIDIREQFPLLEFESIGPGAEVPDILASTMEIARELGIEHHKEPKSGMPIVPSTDFLMTTAINGKEHHHAFEVKPSSKLGSVRTQEKLQLSRTWHERHGHSWSLVTERDIPKYLAENLEFLRKRSIHFNQCGGVPASDVARIEQSLFPVFLKGQVGLSAATTDCDVKLGLEDGTSLLVAYHFIYTRHWRVALQFLMSRLDPGQPPRMVAPQSTTSDGPL